MTCNRFLLTLGLAGLAAALATRPAAADAIDGNWCHQDGKSFSIRGFEIVTPGGTRMEGVYARHSFSYVVPDDEPGAGAIIEMVLIDENTVHLAPVTTAARLPTQVWRRCAAPVS